MGTPRPWQRSRFVDKSQYAQMPASWKAESEQREAKVIRGPGEVGSPGCNVVAVIEAVHPDDREYIITAVLAHDALVAALKRCTFLIAATELAELGNGDEFAARACREVMVDIHAALKQAGVS